MRSYDDKAAALEYSESHVPSFILEEVVVGETAVTQSGWVKGPMRLIDEKEKTIMTLTALVKRSSSSRNPIANTIGIDL